MTQQFHFWVFIRRKQNQYLTKIICTPMFIAALFTVAKMWKQHKCSNDKWIKKMWCIYTMGYFAIGKNTDKT